MRVTLAPLSFLALILAACGQDYDIKSNEGVEDGAEDSADSGGEIDQEGDDTDSGGAVVDPTRPVAVCSVNPTEIQPIREEARWIGEDSYDPNGHEIVEDQWTLSEQPEGSAVGMPSGTSANRSGFSPDLAGLYVGQLIVVNDQGVSSPPCFAELTAIPTERFWVEMYWTHSGDDMDLHLLAPGGSVESYTDDCYFATCVGGGLDWGRTGYPSDDPRLDLDDIPGTGPENINIDDPADGVYTVAVHDYPGSSYVGRNDVTVNIYLDGALTWTDTRDVNDEDGYEYFARINWPAGTVTDM